MGTWGTGIFDDDKASGFLGNLMCLLCGSVRQGIDALDDPGKYRDVQNVPAAVACLRALVTAFKSGKYSMQRSEVEIWRAKWLGWYDRERVDAWVERDDYMAFRGNVEAEFRGLIELLDDVPAEEWDDQLRAQTEKFHRHSFRLG